MISIQLLSFVSPYPNSKLGSGCQYHPRKEGDDGCRPNGIFLLPRWATRSPPHQSPSVTASPQGEASGLCSPTRKKRPKSGHIHGLRNSPTTAPLRPTTPKRASRNERPLTQGGRGQPGPAYPWGGRLRSTLGAQRPGGPACPAGVPISPEKWGERGPGLRPWTPVSWPAHFRSLVLGIVVPDRIEGLFPPVCQNRFGTHFRDKIC